MVFVCGTVKHVGSPFCAQHPLPAARPAFICGSVGCDHSEFPNRIQSHGQNALESLTCQLVVDVDAVQGNVGLIATRSSHCTTASVGNSLVIDPCVDHTGLQTQQSRDVAPFQRQRNNLRI